MFNILELTDNKYVFAQHCQIKFKILWCLLILKFWKCLTIICYIIQCWRWFIWILPSWRGTPYSYCSINRPCCTHLYQWTTFRYIVTLPFPWIVFFFLFRNKNSNMMITGSASGTRENRRFTYTGKVNLRAGTNRIALLSVAVGLPVSLSPQPLLFCKSWII